MTTEPQKKKLKIDTGEAIVTASNTTVVIDPTTLKEIKEDERKNTAPNSEYKAKSYKLMIETWTVIAEWMGIPSEAGADIFVSCELSSIIATAHTMLRQKSDGKFKDRNKNKTSSVTYRGKQYSIKNEEALTIYEKIYEHYAPAEASDRKDFNGCFQPLLFFTLLTKPRFKSARVTPTYKTKGKEGVTIKKVKLSTYGFKGQHCLLLDGMDLPPFITSSIAQSIGTGTVLYNLVNSKSNYNQRWKAAAVKHLKHIPGHNDIIEYLSNDRQVGDYAEIISSLCDLLLAATPRQTNRASIPICMLVQVMTDSKVDIVADREYTMEQLIKEVRAGLTFKEKALAEFNSSGDPLAYYYNEMCLRKFTVPGNLDEEVARTLVILSLFGCAKDDLGIVSWMFGNCRLVRRSDFGDALKNQGTSKEVTIVSLPQLKYFSKLCTSSMSGLFTNNPNQQVSCIPAFSGKRVAVPQADLISLLANSDKSASSVGRTREALLNHINDLKAIIIQKLKRREIGNVLWKTMDKTKCTPVAGRNTPIYAETEIVPTETGAYFYT